MDRRVHAAVATFLWTLIGALTHLPLSKMAVRTRGTRCLKMPSPRPRRESRALGDRSRLVAVAMLSSLFESRKPVTPRIAPTLTRADNDTCAATTTRDVLGCASSV